MNNPYRVGDQVAYLELDAEGLRAERAVVREVQGNDVLISPADDRAAHATTRVTVNENGVAPELEPLTPEVARDMGTKDHAIYPFTNEPEVAERHELTWHLERDREKGMDNGF